ncbi:ROK family protein [Oscillochloris sp. ZM17-4]|uniref:ROK family protein n=1 Tax=Oscillochloris sp. ZM17-4 TaxID=2866714 RepID=UPI001C72A7F1|nr:ROK family protein [Oscillochloris sp. ZM17-4]MBX0327248.1 ROK family protein [Oscillochloris sp. ZM17-4]
MTDLQTLISERLSHKRGGLLSNQGYVLGIDVGSYGLRAALVDLGSYSFTSVDADLEPAAPDDIIEQVIGMAKGLLRDADVAPGRLVRVGVGFGGPLDLRHGVIRLSPRMKGWESYPLQERFEQAFDAVTLIDNDANLIALGEATFGVAKDRQHVFYMHLSSGVGGGAVLNGRLYHGATSTAGEIGHAVVGKGWDGTGRPETLEELVSIRGLLRRAGVLGLETSNLDEIFSDSSAGRQVVQETIDLIATRCAQTIALLDPEMIVLGGIVVRIGGERFIKAISDKMNECIDPQFAHPVPIVASILGHDSVTMGAVALALDSLSD